jgi:Mor family transcriptional regulator
METTTKIETARSGKKLVTDEVVLSMLIDIHQKSSSNYLDYDDLREKYRGTVASILSVLRKREIIIKCGKSIVWQGDYPDMKMATSIKNEYRESARISSKKSQENRAKLAQYKKHQESIKLAEEAILDPLNFEVSPNEFVDLDKTPVHPALMPIEDYQKLQIDSYIRQTSNLESENEKLKSIIELKDETISARQEEYNELLSKASTFTKRVRDLESQLNYNKEKRAIRLFGIKIGSIG